MTGETFIEAFRRWRAALDRCKAGPVAWDIETPGLDPTARTLCLSWTTPDGELVSHWGNLLEAAGFLDQLNPDQLLVAHNAKFEAQSLIARGFDVRSFVWWDTMLAEWVILANNPRGLSMGLDETAQRYGCAPKDAETDALIRDGRVLDVSQDKLLERNRKDVTDTLHVFRHQLARMTEEQVRLTIVRSMQCIELAYIERAGMRLDPERVMAESTRNAAEIMEHEMALREITRGANPKSVNEMAPLLYGLWPADMPEDMRYQWTLGCACDRKRKRVKVAHQCPVCGAQDVKGEPIIEPLGFKEPPDTRTKPTKNWPDGKPSIAKEVMAELATRARTPRQKTWAKHYLALTEAIAERDKNLTFYRGVIESAGGVVYAELMQAVAATHRLSCRSKLRVTVDGKEYGCQLQNTPRHLKGCFIAKRPGWLAFSVDQSQAEFRGAVFLGDDEQGRADIADPWFDAHIQTLTVMLHGPDNFQANYDALRRRHVDGDKEVAWQRADNKLCKGHTFKPLFGGSSGTDRERAYYKWFGQRYAGITATQTKWDQEVQQTGRYVAPTGMEFHWDRTWQPNQWGRESMISAVSGRSLYSIVRNLPIQYFATGELAMVSTLCLLYEARKRGLRYECVMLVHDDTSGEVHPEDEAAMHEVCGVAYGPQTHAALMEIYDVDYDVELAAESKAGVRFGEGRKSEHAYKAPDSNEVLNMKISASGGGGNRAPNVKPGTHVALLCAIVDLGIQKGSAKYPEPKHKVFLRWEFPSVQIEWQDDKGNKKTGPAREGRFLAASMHEKSTLRKVVAGMRGAPFATDAEASAFDVFSLLGKACMVPVTHKVVGDRTYVELGNPVPMPDGLTPAAGLSEPPIAYDTSAHDASSFARLPKGIQDMVNARIVRDTPKSTEAAPAISGGLPDLGTDGQP